MSEWVIAVLSAFTGVLLGVGAVLVWRRDPARAGQPSSASAVGSDGLRPGALDVIVALRSLTIVLDGSDLVLRSAPAAHALGLVRNQRLAHDELRVLVREVRRDQVNREVELELPRSTMGPGRVTLGVRVAALPGEVVLMLIEDRSHVRRVEETRRDFVVNVSHELKTPVGGLALLAEAVEGARDDPEAVERFARRMQIEAHRLGLLVQEIVELSRLQIADTLHEPVLVDVNAGVTAAADHVGVLAEDRDISVRTSLAPAVPEVYGDAELITTAVRNLVTNAIRYSAPGTHVAISVRLAGEVVEIAVSDQGQGIPATEQERIFERFYRVDAARSRETGGTGLGLAIVKHVCLNHGGEVSVWSEEGLGSTFTMRLPLATPDDNLADAPESAGVLTPASPSARKDLQ